MNDTGDETYRPDPEQFAGSLTGWDEQAINRMFRQPLAALDGTMTVRALVFVMERRRQGTDDKAAYKTAMDSSLDDCMARFADTDPDSGGVVDDPTEGVPWEDLESGNG